MSRKQSDISKRMRRYEKPFDQKLPNRMPVFIRCDGRAFHTFCRGFEKPWDIRIVNGMLAAARWLMNEAQNSACAYVQSDEITLMMTPYQRFSTQPWLANRVNKLTSISASIATQAFNENMSFLSGYNEWQAQFDARAFVVPREDALNVFVERQMDCVRNSILGLAQSLYSEKSLHGKSCNQLLVQLESDGNNWNERKSWEKRGHFLVHGDREPLTVDAPDFVRNQDIINSLVYPPGEEGAG